MENEQPAEHVINNILDLLEGDMNDTDNLLDGSDYFLNYYFNGKAFIFSPIMA